MSQVFDSSVQFFKLDPAQVCRRTRAGFRVDCLNCKRTFVATCWPHMQTQLLDRAALPVGILCVAQVILVVKNKVALTHKCVEDYRLSDKSVLDLIHLKEVGPVTQVAEIE